MTGRELYEAIGQVDDWYLDMVDTPERETAIMKEKHITVRKALTYLLAAAITVSLLMVTAAAAGWFPGLFNTLKEKYPEDEALFEAAAQANTDAVPEIHEIPQLDLSKFVLMERYFDGETILIGYDLDTVLPDPVVVAEPEEELLKDIRKGVRCSNIGWDEPQPWFEEPATENAIKHDFTQDAFTMDRMLKGTLSDSEYQKAWNLLKTQGYVCVAVWDVWLGDHIMINGVDIIEDYLADGISYSNRTEYTTEQGNCIRLEPLPEDLKNLDTVTVTVDVRSSIQYWYMDMNGEGRVYFDGSSVESEPLSFQLERSESNG